MQFKNASLLYQLQVLDLTIAKQKLRLKELDAMMNNDEATVNAKSRLAAAEEAIKPLQARARDLELEGKSLTDKIKESDEYLYSGQVTTPKALTELQEEGESLKRRAAHLEQTQIDLMVQLEGDQSAIDSMQAGLKKMVEANTAANADLLKEWRGIRTEVNAAIEKRNELAPTIDPSYVKAYEGLRQRMRGTPVSPMSIDGECTVCGVEQTTMLAHQVRQGRQISYCGNCGRILAVI